LASLTMGKNKNGVQYCIIRISCKDSNGEYKQYNKRILNKDNIPISKFRKECELISLTFEEDVHKNIELELDASNRILTFPELMDEYIEKIGSKLSISYLVRANDVKKRFYPYLKENHLYNKPINLLTVRDIQKFLDSFTTYIAGDGTVKLIRPLPEIVNFRELHRQEIIPRDTSYYMNNRGGRISRTTAVKICNLYHLDIDKYFANAGVEKRYSVTTVKGFRTIIRTIFGEAVRYGWIDRNPASFTKIITNGNNVVLRPIEEKEVFSLKECQEFLEALDRLDYDNINKKVCLKILLLTGIRQAEMAGLKWSDVDFDNGCIHVRRNRLHQSNKGYYEKEPKTRTSIRDIPLPQELLDDLDEYYGWFKLADPYFSKHLDNYYLASNVYREPVANQTIAKWLQQVEQKNGFKPVSCHGLRHTFCSILLSQNVPIQTVSKYMGHSDSTITLKVYSHFIPESKERIINAMNVILKKP